MLNYGINGVMGYYTAPLQSFFDQTSMADGDFGPYTMILTSYYNVIGRVIICHTIKIF